MPQDPDELWIIDRIARGATGTANARLGVGDDAAILADGTLWTIDTMVEGVHWDDRLSAADVGFKLVAINASDIAAMGGRPGAALLALSVPAPLDRAWVDDFATGLAEGCRTFGVEVVGGDTTRARGARVSSLALTGTAARPVLRAGGRPGDRLYVAGGLGLAAEAMLAEAPRPAALAWLRRPAPPTAFGAALGEAGLATAMMDVSDGLRVDLERLCAASGVGARVTGARVPGDGPLAWRVAYGDDYALLFAAPAASADAIHSIATMHRTPLAEVGELTDAPGVLLDGAPDWPRPAFAHFPPEPG